MNENTQSDVRLAVLIDADNVTANHIKAMMGEIARYGNPTIKRIYGDWTRPNLSGWKSCLLDYALSPVQQFAYTSGKNATDSALIIDAMDLLYSDRVDGFVLVSSDSDFTRLAMRLREAGMTVYGLGELKTPPAFIAACDRFIFLEILLDAENDNEEDDESGRAKQKAARKSIAEKKENPEKNKSRSEKEKPPRKESRAIDKIDQKVLRLISQTIHDVEGDDAWAYLGEMANLLLKKQPSFDPRNYGFRSLSQMIKSIDQYEAEFLDPHNSGVKQLYVRVKEEPKKKTERAF